MNRTKLGAFLFLFAIPFATSLTLNGGFQQHPKSLINLAAMAIEYIPCPFPYFPIPYGCWCGVTVPYPPAHEEPIDSFDAKCKTHDICYDESLTQGCSLWDNYVWNYKWKIENGEITCDEDQNFCQKFICECDAKVIKSLAEETQISGCPPKNPGCPDP